MLDLEYIEMKLPMAQYHPKRFSSLLIRVLKPYKAHCQLYKNGKMTVNGARIPSESLALANRFSRMLRSIGYDTSVSNFKIVNVVGSCNLNRKLDLGCLSLILGENYCPELFPELRVKLSDCTAMLFCSGKCNLLGGKSELDLQAGLLELEILL